jgi:hypothetical protein
MFLSHEIGFQIRQNERKATWGLCPLDPLTRCCPAITKDLGDRQTPCLFYHHPQLKSWIRPWLWYKNIIYINPSQFKRSCTMDMDSSFSMWISSLLLEIQCSCTICEPSSNNQNIFLLLRKQCSCNAMHVIRILIVYCPWYQCDKAHVIFSYHTVNSYAMPSALVITGNCWHQY